MERFSFFLRRILALLFGLAAGLALLLADVTHAYAQSASCTRLAQGLDQFTRAPEFVRLEANSRAARDLARQLQSIESTYVRNGCNADAIAGRPLSPQCNVTAREVLRLRDEVARANALVETGTAMAQQREAILQEMARFGCGGAVTTDRQTLFDRIFGTSSEPAFQGGQTIESADPWAQTRYQTIRTVCVRLSDGFFWPISYSTVHDYLGADSMQCQQMCPGTPVELYYYDNPGQEPEQMRNMAGAAYTALPTAFRYRDAFDAEASCEMPGAPGYAVTTSPGAAAQPPLTASASAVQYVDIPLPRPRPPGPGEAPPAAPPEAPRATTAEALRLVQFGDRVVRIVGPDTPYAQSGAAAP